MGDPKGNPSASEDKDKATLHKRDGVYYLSSGPTYATSTHVYGPYTTRGDTGRGFGLLGGAHGRFFTWHGQWFHVYCEFTTPPALLAPLASQGSHLRWRDSWMTYTHYRNNGDMIDDVAFLEQDTEQLGVGQYDARWPRIEAEWFMKSENMVHKAATPVKVELDASVNETDASTALFGVRFPPADRSGQLPYIVFPNVRNLLDDFSMTLVFASCPPGGAMELYAKLSAKPLASFKCGKRDEHVTVASICHGAHELLLAYNSTDVDPSLDDRSLVLDSFSISTTQLSQVVV